MSKGIVITALLFTCLVYTFSGQPSNAANNKVKTYYYNHLKTLSERLLALQSAIKNDNKEGSIQDNFLQARLAYKQLETLLEYYQEGDALKFNGLAINFVEEEDPTAVQVPQGFQMIETFIYPHYDNTRKAALLEYINMLLNITNGLADNTILFKPDEYVLDAVTEELYRITALGITGFDSPIAQVSLQETAASLSGVQGILEIYRQEMILKKISGLNSNLQMLENAKQYLRSHDNFNQFNRMVFITRFINPVCSWLSFSKEKMGYKENPARYSLIKKSGNLFSRKSLRPDTYTGDDTITAARVALGKKLFYDPLLSVTGNRSCASCHHPEKAFTDGLSKALQLDEHTALPRNTPTLWNAALQINLFYDSRQFSLNHLITEVLSNEKEMNSSTEKAIEKIIHRGEYAGLYKKAYPFSDTVIAGKKIVNAVAMYLRTLVSYNSRFDKYMQGEQNKMTLEEIQGFNIFMGKAKCGTCHYAPLFNGSKPPTYYYQESEVLGVPGSTDTVHPYLDTDPGRIRTLPFDFFDHAFKIPTLRNIALTAPYMHNGVYKTLEEVIDFYDKGGGQGLGLSVPNQTLPADKLQLTSTEKKQLKAFMLTLTDTTAIHLADH